MSGLEVFTFVALLVGLLLVIVAMLVWQEAKRRPSYEPLEYVVNDAVKHIAERLPEDIDLKNADIRRILEWEVFYLQGLGQEDRTKPVETVAGGHDQSIGYIADQIHTKHGVSYSQEQIAEVLRLETDYLVAIGAVGEPVGEEE
jgi:hypothetical protein